MTIAEKLTTIAENEPKVFEAGKKSQYDEFWDAYQQNGTRTNYSGAFAGVAWDTTTLKPKYDIVPAQATQMFRDLKLQVNISDYFKNQGIDLDFSKATSFSEFLIWAQITGLGEVDTRSASNINYAFTYAQKLQAIDLLILKEDGSQTFNGAFNQCLALRDITIQGVIGNDVVINNSPLLTIESMRSVISALKDYRNTGATKTLTLHATTKALLTDADKATITQKGWTLA